jgi:uncharacterized protein YbjT (DUF2867 family)
VIKVNIAVVGGTGTFGKLAVRELTARGHDVVTLSRTPPPGESSDRHRRVDLTTGEGLPATLDDRELVIDASNVPSGGKAARAVLVDGTRRLLEAEAAAGVDRHFLISIVGIDRVPYSYYKLKLEQEAALQNTGIPITVLRATQFHQLLDMAFTMTSRFGFLPKLSARLQPVDPHEVAVTLSDAVGEGLWNGRREIAGPQIETVAALARTWKAAKHKGRPLVPLPLLGKVGNALNTGGLTSVDAPRGKVTFAEWLSANAQTS